MRAPYSDIGGGIIPVDPIMAGDTCANGQLSQHQDKAPETHYIHGDTLGR